MSRARDRRKRREREAWAQRKAEQYKRAKAWLRKPSSGLPSSKRSCNHSSVTH